MHLFVTGGCGFIGSNFIRLVLAENPQVRICNFDKLTYAGNLASLEDVAAAYPERYSFVHGDIADAALVGTTLREGGFDAVVNFAAESHVDRSIHDPGPFIQTNIVGVQVLLTQARACGIPRFVHVSTDEVYGTLGTEGLFTESTPLAPNSPYSASKASADLLCRAWYETYGFPVIITRCSNNYGPFQFPEKLIPLMFLRATKGEPLPVYGSGTNVRDWIHVLDHARGVWLALTKGTPGAVYNFGGSAERSNLDVVHEILEYCGQPQSLIHFVADRPGHDLRYAMDFSLAARELGFAPSLTFEQGLRATLEWYGTHAQWVDNVVSGAYRTFMQQWYGERV